MSRRSLRKSGEFTGAALIEALEERRLLYDYVVNGTNNSESMFAQMQGANLVVGINGGSGISIPNPAGKTVRIYALGGNDQIHLVSNGGAIITADGGDGDDIIQLGGGGTAQNLSNLSGDSFLIGGTGADTVFLQDGNNPSPATYTITDSRFDRPGWGGFYYDADIESLRLFNTQFGDTVNVQSTWPNQPIRIINQGGADTDFVGNSSQGVQGMRANLYIEGITGSTNTIYISDVGDTTARSSNFDWDGDSAWGALNNFAPARIIWENANTTQVNVASGSGNDTFVVYGNNSYLVINNGVGNLTGNDTVQIGSPLVGGLISILAPVQIENNPAYTNLVITNEGDIANRTWTIDSANGYGSLTGMSPAPIYWDNADIATISLKCGLGSDSGLILRLSETLSINNSSGSSNLDTITFGDTDIGGMQQITGGGITIDNDPWYTDLIFENNYDQFSRNVTLDFVNSYNVLSGLAPATIRYDDADTKNVTIHVGVGVVGANTAVNVLRTATSGGTTIITSNGFMGATIGNPTTGLQSIIGTTLEVFPSYGSLTFDNRADTVARNIAQTIPFPGIIEFKITGLLPAPIHYGNFSSVQLLGGSGGNTYTIAGTGDANPWQLDTGPGDTVTVDGTNLPFWADARVELVNPVTSLASLTIQGDASVALTGPANQVLVTGSINLTGTAALDVRDKAVIVNYSGASPIESIRAAIASGYSAGAWNGPGINSSTAATTAGTAVGFADATDLFTTFPATFAGQSVDNTSVLLRHTLNGDANLDRNTNLVDFNRLASNFGQPSRRWSTGDFNFDTGANLADFNLLAGQFGQALGPDGGISQGTEFGEIPILPSTKLRDRELAALLTEFV